MSIFEGSYLLRRGVACRSQLKFSSVIVLRIRLCVSKIGLRETGIESQSLVTRFGGAKSGENEVKCPISLNKFLRNSLCLLREQRRIEIVELRASWPTLAKGSGNLHFKDSRKT